MVLVSAIQVRAGRRLFFATKTDSGSHSVVVDRSPAGDTSSANVSHRLLDSDHNGPGIEGRGVPAFSKRNVSTRNKMATDFNPFPEILGGEGPVPPVDPANLRSLWEMQRGLQTSLLQAGVGGEQTSIDIESYRRACTSGANIGALWYRLSQISLLQMLGALAPWIHEGVIADAVFKVAASFPMEGVPFGVPRQGLPFDVEEFLSQVAAS